MRRQETPDWSKSSMSNRDVVSVTNIREVRQVLFGDGIPFLRYRFAIRSNVHSRVDSL